MKHIMQFACVVTVLSCHYPTLGSMPEWNTFQGSERHTGYVPVLTNIDDLEYLWERTFSAALNPVAIGGGHVFASEQGRFASNRGLSAIDSQSGLDTWTYPDFGPVNSINPPAYANGRVYLQTGKQSSSGIPPYLYAFDASNGGLAFRSEFSAQWETYYAPTIYESDVYINGGYYGGAYRYDGVNGNREWFTSLPQYDDWTPAVDQQYVYAYVGEYQPGLYVIDRTTGVMDFRIPDTNFDWNGWSMNLAPVLTDDGDVIAIHDGRLIRFDVDGRSVDWELDRNFSGQPTIAGDVLYAIDSNTLTARDALTGEHQWSWVPTAGDSVTGNIIATDSHVFAQTNTSTYAINLATKEVDWSYNASGSLALGEGILTIVDGSSLYAFSVDVGPEPIAIDLDIKPGPSNNTVALNGNGTLQMAILANADFNVADVDIDSLLFGDPNLVDGGATPLGSTSDKLRDLNHDGLDDLLVGFSISDLVDGGALDASSVEGRLTGELFDGTPIIGSDIVRMVPQNNGAGGGSPAIAMVPEPSSCTSVLAALCFALSRSRRA